MNIFNAMNIFTLLLTICLSACLGNVSGDTPQDLIANAATPVVEKATIISEAEFKTLVMNYETNPDKWIFEGNLPCIVDFYADWCPPCRRMAPILDELAKEYAGRVNIYKVNIDRSRNLASYFGIQSVPTLLFCPLNGRPAMQPGAMNKVQFIDAIENFLLKDQE